MWVTSEFLILWRFREKVAGFFFVGGGGGASLPKLDILGSLRKHAYSNILKI